MTYHHQRRLDRADYHLDRLDEEMHAWREENPYRTWTEPDVDSTKELLYVEVLKPPPAAELSLIIGDCLHNLRSALDNLVFELAIAYVGIDPLTEDRARLLEFPIFGNREMNARECRKKIGSIHPDAQAIIKGLQPYNRGHRFTNDPLWQLNRLSVEDKHRLPHVVLLATVGMSFRVSALFAIDEVEPILGPVDRAPIARYPTVDETGAKVNVHLTPTFNIGFGQRAPKQLRGLPVPDKLAEIHRYITNKVVPPLAPYLD